MKNIKSLMLIFVLVFICGCDNSMELNTSNNSNSTDVTNNTTNIIIDLKGEVLRPGIYEFKYGITLYEVIEAAGGFTIYADIYSVNLTEEFTKNTMKIIPSKLKDNEIVNSDLININKCSQKELESLPGIGTSISLRIIEYRETYGLFETIEDIKKVSGIGDALFNKIKDKITV